MRPVMVTEEPTGPLFGLRLPIVVDAFTAKAAPLLGPPADVVTTTGPLDVPGGTATTIAVALQLEMAVAGVPLNVTVLVP